MNKIGNAKSLRNRFVLTLNNNNWESKSNTLGNEKQWLKYSNTSNFLILRVEK